VRTRLGEIAWRGKTGLLSAYIRADHNFKVADSIQLATAVEGGADLFLTNDGDLKRFTEVRVITLSDLSH
jgi:predicted nucleic acid-binding protein